MIVIGNAVLEDDIRDAEFCCDVNACKGACCVLPGARGAPLLDDEIPEIQAAAAHAIRYMPEANARRIESFGSFEGSPGDFATLCIDDRECVFVYYEGDVARCALERAYIEGTTRWKKPISCHLFPIRVRRGVEDHLRYERIPECTAGRDRGKAEGVKLYQFLREPLVREYGTLWYERLAARARQTT